MVRTLFSILVSLISFPVLAAACDPTISLNVSRPHDTEWEPTVIAASVTSGCPVTLTRVYLDNKKLYEQTGRDPINARVVMRPGFHHVVYQAWNSAGAMARQDRYVTTLESEGEPVAGCEYDNDGIAFTGDVIPSTTTSPVRVAMGGNPHFSSIRLYIDGVNRAQTYGTTGYCLPVAYLSLKTGYHFINLQAWDSTGRIYLSGTIIKVVP